MAVILGCARMPSQRADDPVYAQKTSKVPANALVLSGLANSWIVGNPYLTGLRKGCPSLGNNRKDEKAYRIFGERLSVPVRECLLVLTSEKGRPQSYPSPH